MFRRRNNRMTSEDDNDDEDDDSGRAGRSMYATPYSTESGGVNNNNTGLDRGGRANNMHSMPNMARQTSFARSFFQAGDQHGNLRWSDDDDEAVICGNSGGKPQQFDPAPSPRNRPRSMMARKPSQRSIQGMNRMNMLRQQSSRRMMLSLPDFADSEDEGASSSSSAAPKNRAIPPAAPEPKSSWYRDALAMTDESNLQEILGAVRDEDENEEEVSDEVLEQFRIMAHHEARQRLKENLGCDLGEFVERVRNEPKGLKMVQNAGYDPKNPPRLPLPAPRPPPNDWSFLPRPKRIRPTIPLPSFPRERFIRPQPPSFTFKELQMGKLLRSSEAQLDGLASFARDNTVMVRCLGCYAQLLVGQEATLVRCPECMTVSPATSCYR